MRAFEVVQMGEDPFFGETVMAALRLAAAERPTGTPLTTGRVLSALARVDMTNDWQRIWLHTGDPVLTDVADAPDPADAPLPASGPQAVRDCRQWEGVPVSGCLARALTLLKRICARYRLVPAPSGAMALAPYDRAGAPPGPAPVRSGLPGTSPFELTGGDSPVTAAVRSIC